jgi:outer membrane receptor protein involved in Fe transport
VYQNCLAEGLPLNFHQNSGIEVNSAGGAEIGLSSEDSKADTAGIIIQPPLPTVLGDLSFAVDWWQIDVNGQVTQIGGNNLLTLCYNDPDFRNGGSYCAYSSRDSNNKLTVEDNYINIAYQRARGLDYNVRYERDIGLGVLTADAHATRYLRQQNRLLPTDMIDEYNGEVQAPKWVADLDLRYERKELTFYYGLIFVGKQNSNARYEVDPAVDPYNFSVGNYLLHNVSARYKSLNGWEIIVGVRNLLDKVPPTMTPGVFDNRVGNSVLYSGYDYYGRRAYVSASKNLF